MANWGVRLLAMSFVGWSCMTLSMPIAAATEDADSSRADAIVEEAELTMEMARDGQYGRIKPKDMERLESAHARIVELLEPVDSPDELQPEQRQSLEQAQSIASDILKAGDPNRRICKRVAATGTRLGAMECLTLAQRRDRARSSRYMVEDAQRGFCISGEGNSCTH